MDCYVVGIVGIVGGSEVEKQEIPQENEKEQGIVELVENA